MLPVVPLVLGGGTLAFAVYRVKKSKKGKLTPERKKVFEQAMQTLKDPVKLNALADGFTKAGLLHHASELHKRAKLFSLSPEKKAAYHETYQKALASKDPTKVSQVADAFRKVGAHSAAQSLKQHAMGLITQQGGSPTVNVPSKAA